MPHNDLHKTERQLRAGASKNVKSPSAGNPKSIAKPKSPDESQSLSDCIDFNSLLKVGGSHIYTRTLPGENGQKTLRIDGPGDSGIALDTQGTVRIITGIHDPNRGAGSGKLLIKTNGQQQLHQEPSFIQYNAGGENGDAWNVLAYGDVVHEARGSEYTIRAQKITIIADEELSLIGHGGVKIQAGQSGKGPVDIVGGTITQTSTNEKKVVSGQQATEVSEQTTTQFDPRASTNFISPGNINHKVLGDFNVQIGGVFHTDVAGKSFGDGGLVSGGRDSSYRVKTAAGDSQLSSPATNVNIDGIAVSVNASEGFNVTAGANIDMTAAAEVNITGTGNVTIQGALIYLN